MHRPIPFGPPGHLARRFVLPAAVVLAMGACAGAGTTSGETATAGGGGMTVAATTTILGDVTREVVGDGGDVVTLMPVGADPHSYQLSAREVDELTEADLVVTIGGGLEASLDAAIATAAEAGVPVFSAVDHTDTLTIGATGADDDHADDDGTTDTGEDGDHGAGSVDPHVWMDPVRMAEVVRALGDEVGRLDGSGADARAEDYATRLEEVDAQIRDILGPVPDRARRLVTNHDALTYFADRYDFEIVGTVVPTASTGAEPSARDLEHLVDTIAEHRVGAIFLETTAPDRLAQTVAAEVGSDIEVVELYTGSLGEEGSDAATYVDLLTTDAQRIADALGAVSTGSS